MVKVSPIYKEFFQPVSTPTLILNTSCQIQSLNDQAAKKLNLKEYDFITMDEPSKRAWEKLLKGFPNEAYAYCTLNVKVGEQYEKLYLSCHFDNKTQQIYARLINKIGLSDNINKKLAQISSMFCEFSHGLIITDLDGEIISINNIGLELLGIDKCQLVNQTYENIFKNFSNNQISTFQYFRELSTNGQATVELSRKNDDRVLWLKLESKLNSSLGIILTTITDETEKYILKQKVEQHKNLNAIGQMTASIAHEIRNPMTSLKGFIELLKINCSENEKKYLNVMNSELERMDSILSEILYLSNPNERIYEEVQFTKIIHNVIELMNPLAELKNITFQMNKIEPVNEKVIGNENRLKQMMINLVKNAIEVMDSGGNITIKIYNEINNLKVAVCDEGKGIKEEEISNLFTPFYTTKENGSGLGLILVKKVIEEHDGEISVESKLGIGTTFTIKLPTVHEAFLKKDDSQPDLLMT